MVIELLCSYWTNEKNKKKNKKKHTTPVEKETWGNSEVACSSDSCIFFWWNWNFPFSSFPL